MGRACCPKTEVKVKIYTPKPPLAVPKGVPLGPGDLHSQKLVTLAVGSYTTQHTVTTSCYFATMLLCDVPRAVLPKKHIAVLWTRIVKVTRAAHESHLPQSNATHLGRHARCLCGRCRSCLLLQKHTEVLHSVPACVVIRQRGHI